MFKTAHGTRFPRQTSLRSGFSLIELVVVITILTIIAGIALPQYSQFSAKAQDSRRVSDLVAVEKALDLYFTQFGTYPTTGGEWRGDAPSYGGHGYGATGYIPGLVPDYIKELPRDPDPSRPTAGQGYLYRSDGVNYKFLAHQTPTTFPTNHRFFDPQRPTWAYQVSSSGTVNW